MRKTIFILVIVLLVVCGIGAFAMKGMAPKKEETASNTIKVTQGTLLVSVVESGAVDATKSVEVKGRVTGRLAKLFVDEGDMVTAGQLIAVIDPKETALRVEQDQAQLSGAQSGVGRLGLEIEQRRKTAVAAYNQARVRMMQLDLEAKTQPTLTNAAITQAQTSLRTAEQEKQRLLQSVHPTQRVSAQSAVDEAKASYENAKRDADRQAELLSKGYVAGRVAEAAKLTMDLATARLTTANENLNKLDAQHRAELSKAEDQIQQATAELSRAKANSIQNQLKRQEYLTAVAEMEKARAALSDPAILKKQLEQSQATVAQLRSVVSDSVRQLGETDIRAPISGIVTKKGIQVGELATGLSQFSSGSTIVKIEDRRSMRVKLNVNEIDVAKMRIGMKAKVDVDALPEKSFEGTVRKIAPASREAAQGGQADAVVRYEVEVELSNPTPQLRSGMTAKCTIDVIRREDVLTIPVEYVQKDQGRYYVYLAPSTKGGQPEKKQIQVGAASGTKYEVTGGVKSGDELTKPGFTGPKREGMMQAGGPD